MMKKSKLLVLCAVLSAGLFFATGCGNNGDMNGTEAPYEDETNRNVNDMNNGSTNNGTTNNGATNNGGTSNNGTVEGDLERSGDSLQDAGRNFMDSIQETGDALRNGVDNLTNDVNNTNNSNNINNPENTNNTTNGTNMNP